MKIKLKNNHEVGHYWANQVQDSGRGSNLFFEGNTIYSYGYHFLIAKHIKPGIVLFNANSYSQSTAKHKSIVRGAIPHGTTVLTVPDIDINGRRGAWDQRAHKNNIKYLLNKIRKYLLKAGRARKYGEYYTKQALGYFRMMDKYLSIFKCKSNLPYKIKKEIKYFAGCNWISIQSEIKEADSIKRKRINK